MSTGLLYGIALALLTVGLAYAINQRDRTGILTGIGNLVMVLALFLLGGTWLGIALAFLGLAVALYGTYRNQKSKPEPGRWFP